MRGAIYHPPSAPHLQLSGCKRPVRRGAKPLWGKFSSLSADDEPTQSISVCCCRIAFGWAGPQPLALEKAASLGKTAAEREVVRKGRPSLFACAQKGGGRRRQS